MQPPRRGCPGISVAVVIAAVAVAVAVAVAFWALIALWARGVEYAALCESTVARFDETIRPQLLMMMELREARQRRKPQRSRRVWHEKQNGNAPSTAASQC